VASADPPPPKEEDGRLTVFVFDTGALIAIERRDLRMSKRLMRARELKALILVPTPVLGEWWRGRTDWREAILAAVIVEPLDAALAKTAGEAMAKTRGATLVDAVVMASAARSGGVVYTSDFGDLARLQSFFPPVRVFEV
jgi:predicted nucleic acid-binding protein